MSCVQVVFEYNLFGIKLTVFLFSLNNVLNEIPVYIITEVFSDLSSIYRGNQKVLVLEDKKTMYLNERFSLQ